MTGLHGAGFAKVLRQREIGGVTDRCVTHELVADVGGRAAVLAERPQFEPLAAGEIVTTGTLTAAMPIRPGEVWSSEYAGLPIDGLTLTFVD